MKILIVDNNYKTSQGIVETLSESIAEASIECSKSFKAGLSNLRRSTYDLVFIDQVLGRNKGTELIENIPHLNRRCQFVILTEFPINSEHSGIFVNKNKELSSVAVFQKPIDKKFLDLMIAKIKKRNAFLNVGA